MVTIVTDIKDRTVLITGGASGIGALLGERVLEAGAARLVLWDINAAGLTGQVDAMRGRGFQVDAFTVDITDLAQVQAALREMSTRSIDTDILVNNAGVVVAKEFAAHTHEDIERSMRVNALAPMHIASQILPGMLQRGRGHLVNIASAAGLVSSPRMSVYCASKWAMVGWSVRCAWRWSDSASL